LGAQTIFAETDGVARAGCAMCTVTLWVPGGLWELTGALWELTGCVADVEAPQLVMLSTQAKTASTKNVMC
jgi:hypothetical protein